jgi:hypothetical protein
MSLRSKVKEAMMKAATQGDWPSTAAAISKEDWNAGACCTPVVLVAKAALAVIDNEVGDESAIPMRSVRGKLNPKADYIDVVAGDLQIYWANNLLSVWREDYRDVGVCISAEDENELHVTACGRDVVLDPYSNTDVLLRIRAQRGEMNRTKFNPTLVAAMGTHLENPICPDCDEVMVKAKTEDEEGSWSYVWLCGCKVEPPSRQQWNREKRLGQALRKAEIECCPTDNVEPYEGLGCEQGIYDHMARAAMRFLGQEEEGK